MCYYGSKMFVFVMFWDYNNLKLNVVLIPKNIFFTKFYTSIISTFGIKPNQYSNDFIKHRNDERVIFAVILPEKYKFVSQAIPTILLIF